MRILFLTDSSTKTASFRYRVHQYIPMLESEGICCTVAHPREFPFRRIGRLREYDAVLVQKRLLPVPWVLSAGIAAKSLFFDFDDAIWTCPNLDWDAVTRAKVKLRLRTILAKSTRVIAGNKYLGDYAQRFNSNVTIIPTCVDTDHYRPAASSHQQGKLCIGWIGSSPNLIYLERLEPVFKRLPSDNIFLSVVCDMEYKSPNLPTEFTPWSLDGELGALQSMDVGVMPLADDEWTRGKCGFKTIQYMACGIPSISSPVGVNNEIVNGRNGFLARDDDEWVEKLSLLINDSDLRRSIGKEGRRTVEDKYSIGIGGKLLAQAIRSTSFR